MRDLRAFRTAAIAALLAAAVGCASLTVKQRASQTHQTIRQVLNAIDDLELAICQPAQAEPGHCTNPANLITDAQHQEVSRVLVQAFEADIKVGRAIIAWQPCLPNLDPAAPCVPTPPPTDLATLRGYVDQVKGVVLALAPSQKAKDLLELVSSVLAMVDEMTASFARRVAVALRTQEVAWTR